MSNVNANSGGWMITAADGRSVSVPADAVLTIDFSSASNSGSYSYGPLSSSSISSFVSPPFTKIACQHVTAENDVEYIDGTVYAQCVLCDERIQISRTPGGVALLAAKSLVAALTLSVEDDLLTLLHELTEQLEANRQALEEFEGLLDLARQMVKESCE